MKNCDPYISYIAVYISYIAVWLRAPVDSRLHFIAPERTTLSIIINKGVIYIYLSAIKQGVTIVQLGRDKGMEKQLSSFGGEITSDSRNFSQMIKR